VQVNVICEAVAGIRWARALLSAQNIECADHQARCNGQDVELCKQGPLYRALTIRSLGMSIRLMFLTQT